MTYGRFYPVVTNKAEDRGEPADSVTAHNVIDGQAASVRMTRSDDPLGEHLASSPIWTGVPRSKPNCQSLRGPTLDSLAKVQRPPSPQNLSGDLPGSFTSR